MKQMGLNPSLFCEKILERVEEELSKQGWRCGSVGHKKKATLTRVALGAGVGEIFYSKEFDTIL